MIQTLNEYAIHCYFLEILQTSHFLRRMIKFFILFKKFPDSLNKNLKENSLKFFKNYLKSISFNDHDSYKFLTKDSLFKYTTELLNITCDIIELFLQYNSNDIEKFKSNVNTYKEKFFKKVEQIICEFENVVFKKDDFLPLKSTEILSDLKKQALEKNLLTNSKFFSLIYEIQTIITIIIYNPDEFSNDFQLLIKYVERIHFSTLC
ncbi:hypothetical protein A0H76_1692 [Hepatospora eriocheir]|uniref:Uncharacterized protein n=1 Tax=Hepatospora eriocheir TaxID=1081669 RepID=A0A1X0QLN6_9MICR|nr:hypothetical protein A0H76_1692 [Hepatospora eriocheir]